MRPPKKNHKLVTSKAGPHVAPSLFLWSALGRAGTLAAAPHLPSQHDSQMASLRYPRAGQGTCLETFRTFGLKTPILSAPEISFTLNYYPPPPSMVIAALSQETVRLLGSPTVITTPVDLVKELLDNALDAKATSVEVLVAPNLVDRLEVRDNGHGISQEDYDSLGRTGHTSKITSFDEIPYLGGTTLGFRGQALASANTLGKVTVTTRTSKDPTAMLITLRARVGGVDGKQRTSAPVGTTVGVTGLYSNLPVRVRTAIKDAPKNMSKIKQLLHEYALARPGPRLSFKSLGGKAAWSYSPRPQATVREAVVQTFGTEVMSQCMIRTICSSQADDEPKSTQDNEQMSMQAVLPSADGDLTKVANKGAFFAVDSRPLTSADGAMKKLLKTFKSFLARTLRETGGHDCPRDPFVCVNIRCSPGSYDVNVEPSKNQVIFASESRLTDLFERLCTEVYRTPQNTGAFATLETRRLLQGPQTQTPPLSSDGPDEDARPDKQAPLASSHGSTMHDSTVVGNSRAFQSVRPYEPGLGSPKQSLTTTCGATSSEVCHTRKAPHRHRPSPTSRTIYTWARMSIGSREHQCRPSQPPIQGENRWDNDCGSKHFSPPVS